MTAAVVERRLDIRDAVLERSDDVLWSLALPGIVLHHLGTREYLVLDDLGYRLWAFLDGARTGTEAVSAALALDETADTAHAWQMLAVLAAHGFVVDAR